MNKQVAALTKVIGKKEEQLQALRHHQTHMTTTIEQLQGEVKKNSAAAAADRAAKTYAADLQTKVHLCWTLYCLPALQSAFASMWSDVPHCIRLVLCFALCDQIQCKCLQQRLQVPTFPERPILLLVYMYTACTDKTKVRKWVLNLISAVACKHRPAWSFLSWVAGVHS